MPWTQSQGNLRSACPDSQLGEQTLLYMQNLKYTLHKVHFPFFTPKHQSNKNNPFSCMEPPQPKQPCWYEASAPVTSVTAPEDVRIQPCCSADTKLRRESHVSLQTQMQGFNHVVPLIQSFGASHMCHCSQRCKGSAMLFRARWRQPGLEGFLYLQLSGNNNGVHRIGRHTCHRLPQGSMLSPAPA